MAISPPGYSVKSVIDPRSCLAMHNHYCWEKITDGIYSWKDSVNVEHSLALLHHYKKCHFSESQCAELMKNENVSVDDTALKYQDALTPLVQVKLEEMIGEQ